MVVNCCASRCSVTFSSDLCGVHLAFGDAFCYNSYCWCVVFVLSGTLAAAVGCSVSPTPWAVFCVPR